jgi:flagellar basal body-associated protein FliL
MNKKGSSAFVLLMLGVVFFLLGMALAPALTEASSESQEELDCSDPDILNQNKAVCYQLDMFPAFITGLIMGIGAIVLGRSVGL